MAKALFYLAALLSAAWILPACSGGGRGPGRGGGAGTLAPEIAFTAEPAGSGVTDLFVTDFKGSTALKLTGSLGARGAVTDLHWSPDGRWIAFRSDRDSAGIPRLYVVPSGGGAPVKVSGDLFVGQVFAGGGAAWAPDSSRIGYLAAAAAGGPLELFTVLPTGHGNIKVSGPLVAGGLVRSLHWAPDSARVAYDADQETDGRFELYTSLAAGGGNAKVSGPLVAGGSLFGTIQWAPDSSRVAYSAQQDTYGIVELYTTLASGGGNVKVSGPMVSGGAVDPSDWSFAWAPDSSRLAYAADQETNGKTELFTCRPWGGGSVKVSGSIVAGGGIGSFRWAPDSSRIAYIADQAVDEVAEAYTSLAGGGGNVRISGPLVPGGDVLPYILRWAPDGTRIAYAARQDRIDVVELYTVTPTGAGNLKVSGPPGASESVAFYLSWAPNGSRLEYRTISGTSSRLYTGLPAAAGGHARIAGPISPASSLGPWTGLLWAPNSTRVAYTTPGRLFSASATGGDVIELSGALGGVTSIAVRP